MMLKKINDRTCCVLFGPPCIYIWYRLVVIVHYDSSIYCFPLARYLYWSRVGGIDRKWLNGSGDTETIFQNASFTDIMSLNIINGIITEMFFCFALLELLYRVIAYIPYASNFSKPVNLTK